MFLLIKEYYSFRQHPVIAIRLSSPEFPALAIGGDLTFWPNKRGGRDNYGSAGAISAIHFVFFNCVRRQGTLPKNVEERKGPRICDPFSCRRDVDALEILNVLDFYLGQGPESYGASRHVPSLISAVYPSQTRNWIYLH